VRRAVPGFQGSAEHGKFSPQVNPRLLDVENNFVSTQAKADPTAFNIKGNVDIEKQRHAQQLHPLVAVDENPIPAGRNGKANPNAVVKSPSSTARHSAPGGKVEVEKGAAPNSLTLRKMSEEPLSKTVG